MTEEQTEVNKAELKRNIDLARSKAPERRNATDWMYYGIWEKQIESYAKRVTEAKRKKE